MIGDSGYANTAYLATPFTAARVAMDPASRRYNRSIISTRDVVERQYGLWKRRFPVLAYGMRLRRETCQKVIVACAVLHNMAIDMNEPPPPEDNDLDRVIDENENARNDENDARCRQYRIRVDGVVASKVPANA